MRNVVEIRKLFWLINLILLATILHIVISFFPLNNAGENTFARPIAKKVRIEIIPCIKDLPPGSHSIIIERNIFGTSGVSPSNDNLLRNHNNLPTTLIKSQFRLLATISGDDQVACAVIENMKTKVQDIYKAGDIINGAQIERIDRNKIIFFCGGQREVLNLRITCSALGPVERSEERIMDSQKPAEFVKVIPPLERDISKQVSETKAQGMQIFLEKMEITPYIINGEGKGLRIEGLDDFSLARYAGFKNGDVIQALNGQLLTNKQKAFQVLKKARTQSSLDFELLRNQREMNLSFNLK